MVKFKGYTVETLFDPVQTHVIKGLTQAEVAKLKEQLKQELKATRFRVVKGYCNALCFKLKEV